MLRLGCQLIIRQTQPSVRTKTVPSILTNVNLQQRVKQPLREVSFFNQASINSLWNSWTSVSNAGKKRGRGQGRNKKIKPKLYSTITPQIGKANVSFPGWHTLVQQRDSPDPVKMTSKSEGKPVETKERKSHFPKIHPLGRGWSGKKFNGKKMGPPEVDGETLEGFETIVIEHKMVSNMTKLFGRTRNFTTFVITGNGNGVIGMGKSSKQESKLGLALAQLRSSKRLITIELEKPGEVNYSFVGQFGNTKVIVFKKSPGYGLKCHRVVKACCELLGINNIRAKVEGPMNYRHIVKAFVYGLLNQKTYQELADESKCYLVELRQEEFCFPRLLRKPKSKPEEDPTKVPTSFEEFVTGKMYWKCWEQPRPEPAFTKLPSWEKHLKRSLYKRNHDKVKLELMEAYGGLKSHLTEIYPECTAPVNIPKKTEETVEGDL